MNTMSLKSEINAGIRFLTDKDGNKSAVVVPIALYERIMRVVEDVEDDKEADAIMRSDPEFEDLEFVAKRFRV